MHRNLPLSATGQLLLDQHKRMEALIERLRHDIHCGDWGLCQATWNQFERYLVDHLETEERYLLPIFEREHAEDSAALREDHANIRGLLADIGIRLELHTVREQHFRRFIELLKKHAAREEALLYRWATQLPRDVADTLGRRLEANKAAEANDGDRGTSQLT